MSKTKPIEDIIAAYSVGQRDFGENYIQELEEKSNNPQILEQCKDIRWHFIGLLQTKNTKKALRIPNLHMVQTIHSEKLAELLNKLWEKERLQQDGKLKVLVQVNTSGEDAKNGVDPEKAVEVVEFINDKCIALMCEGLMTIGEFGYDYSKGPNPGERVNLLIEGRVNTQLLHNFRFRCIDGMFRTATKQKISASLIRHV